MEVYGVIYIITCLLNGMKYVGQTARTIQERFKQHKYEDTYIGRAMQKYGLRNFIIEVIEECETAKQLNEREKFWIIKLNTKRPNGYNVSDGGAGSSGYTRTIEQCFKLSAARKNPSPYPNLTAILESQKITYGGLAKKLGWHTSKLAKKYVPSKIFLSHK